MTNWTDIHPDFAEWWAGDKNYQQLWEESLTYQDAQEWIQAGFEPNDYWEIKNWKEQGFTTQEITQWKSIHPDFIPELFEKWKRLGFNKEQTKRWIETGIEYNDCNFVSYLVNNEKITPETILSREEFKDLQNRYQRYDLCSDCQQPNTGEKWCRNCNAKRFAQDFDKWTSGNEEIDKFIQECQLKAANSRQVLEWIPYKNFGRYESQREEEEEKKLPLFLDDDFIKRGKLDSSDINFLTEGGFGKIYVAMLAADAYLPEDNTKWRPIKYWDNQNNCWKRSGQEIEEKISFLNAKNKDFQGIFDHTSNLIGVVLKSLNNSQDIKADFLREITYHKLLNNDKFDYIITCYGISQDPKTKNYLMVMDYKADGDIRLFLQRNYERLNFKNKLEQLYYIISGLNSVHQQGLVHKDFHVGNILKGQFKSYITDLGLCKPINEKEEGKIYGVMPYVAPEVLQGHSYTQKSDIYSFGIVAYEWLANSYPYPKLDGVDLALKVCQGHRPNIDELKIPQELKNLIKSCWDTDPQKRPTAKEAHNIIRKLYNNHYSNYWNFKIEEYDSFSQNTPYKIHSTSITTSKLINTKEINQRLQSSQLSNESSQPWQDSGQIDLEIPEFPTEELNQLDFNEEIQQPEQQPQILQLPYGTPGSNK